MKNYYKGRKPSHKEKTFDYNINEQIRSPKLFIVDENGEKLGEVTREAALNLAREKELDLVEVAPNANPPVARIMSWSKFKYQLEKKSRESKSKRIEQKEMWFKSFISSGDLAHKIKKVKEFLEKKNPVKLTIKTKGRVSKEILDKLMRDILQMLEGMIEYDDKPKFEGRNLTLIVRPTKAIKNQNHETENKDTQSNS